MWSRYRKDTWSLVGGTLIVLVLMQIASIVAAGIVVGGAGQASSTATELSVSGVTIVVSVLLLGPLGGGLIGIPIRRARGGRRGRSRDVFRGFRQFAALATAGLVSSVVYELMSLGGRLHWSLAWRLPATALFFALAVLLVYVAAAIVDQGLAFPEAVRFGVSLLRPPELWRTVVALVALRAFMWLVGNLPADPLHRTNEMAGLAYLVAAIIVFLPMSVCYVVCMYMRACAASGATAHGQSSARMVPPPTV
jgi:hypothetical protein